MDNKMKPILFNTPMVQAILENRKTQTRRIISPQPDCEDCFLVVDNTIQKWKAQFSKGRFPKSKGPASKPFAVPYQPGDILYVRETFAPISLTYDWETGYVDDIELAKVKEVIDYEKANGKLNRPLYAFAYKTDGYEDSKEDRGFNWTPSIHMPIEAARIFLRITAVKAQRLQDITEADAIAEGIELFPPNQQIERRKYMLYRNPANGATHDTAVKAFQSLWIGINGLESFTSNPYVLAYTFQRCDAPHSIPQSFNPSIL